MIELDRLAERVRACHICVDAPAGRPMPHAPRPVLQPSATASVLVAGQAPGTKVHATGIPFSDASGHRLRDWLGVSHEEFYDPRNFAILPMGFCFPGHDARGADLPPRRECAPAWRSALLEKMPKIELVLAIGLYAQRWHMGNRRSPSLTETVRDRRGAASLESRPRVLPLPHPSWRNTGWLKRNPWFEMELLPFLRAEIRARLVPFLRNG